MIRDVTVFLDSKYDFTGRKLVDLLYPPEIVAEMSKEPVVEVLPVPEIVRETDWSWA